MKIAFFDCFAGAAGDMIVAAMLDAGLDRFFLTNQLDTLNIKGLKLNIDRTVRCGIAAATFCPETNYPQDHRKLQDIIEIIAQSKISASAKTRAIKIFESLADAEGAVHGKRPDDIHFHEIGAVDSIVDIVAACVGLEALEIDTVYSSPLAVGSGTVKCAHGLLPVPAPATVQILKNANAPIIPGPGKTELLTPTGAAILTSITTAFSDMPPMTINTVGHGAGTHDSSDFPNILRLIIGNSSEKDDCQIDSVTLIQANIDDKTPEQISFAAAQLLQKCALDVWTTPIIMKKGRPAVMLSVICTPQNTPSVEQNIFSNGLSLGIRKQIISRKKLKRKIEKINTEFGEIKIKIAYFQNQIVSVKPEYTDCANAAEHKNLPIETVQNAALKAFELQKTD